MPIESAKEVLRADVHGNARGETIRVFSGQAAVDQSVWFNIGGAQKGTIQITGSGTFTIEVRGLNFDGDPDVTNDGHTLISNITAVGLYELAKLPVTWLKLKVTAATSASITAWVHLAY